jgi:hypothetical protein
MSKLAGRSSWIFAICAILICLFILTSGCFSIPEVGVYVNDQDDRSHIVPFFGEIQTTPTTPAPAFDENMSENNTLPETPVKPPDTFPLVPLVLIVTGLIVGSVLFLKFIKIIVDKIRLDDGVLK